MRYNIRQKIFSFGDNFAITDEYDNEAFIVRGKVFSFGDKLRIEDLNSNELVYIEQELFHLFPVYNLYINGECVATVKKNFTLFGSHFSIDSSVGNFEVDGEFLSHEFTILKNGNVVAEISKRWFSFSDTYGVDIYDEENESLILALAIVIDQVLHDNDGHR